MNVDLSNSGVRFSSINCGECFEYAGNLYIKIQSGHIEIDSGYGARLTDGLVSKINAKAHVHKLHLKVVEDTDSQ